LHEHVESVLADSESYFRLEPATAFPFHLHSGVLSFPSPVETGVPSNDVVFADFFPSSRSLTGDGPEHESQSRGAAVVVLPQWNARRGAQNGLCRLLNRFGMTALKLVLPYHERRMPEELMRADYVLSPNVGRTLSSCRQAVLDARAAIQWLRREGYGPLGIVGTSLGSSIAFITFAHEEHLDAAVFNHISPYFADVVWRGISTRQVREGLEAGVSLDELRRLWLPLSPKAYFERVASRSRPSLLVYARYDFSFPIDLSREVLDAFLELGIEHERYELPCGHYTTAKFPFNWMDGLAIARFLHRRLVK
jgi:hypothetical protein